MNTNEKQTQQIDSNDLEYSITADYSDGGGNTVRVDITLPYGSLTTVQNIHDCNECPIGYPRTAQELGYEHGCGWKAPMKHGCRPETCKLNIKTVSDVLRELADKLDVERMLDNDESGGTGKWLI